MLVSSVLALTVGTLSFTFENLSFLSTKLMEEQDVVD